MSTATASGSNGTHAIMPIAAANVKATNMALIRNNRNGFVLPLLVPSISVSPAAKIAMETSYASARQCSVR